jgi:hypothetical protein
LPNGFISLAREQNNPAGMVGACSGKWSQRFELSGLEGPQDQEGRGRPSWLSEEQIPTTILTECELASMFFELFSNNVG